MKEEKILTFRTCKEGFEKLVSEWKCEYKYREVKKFWESRLLKDWKPKNFDKVFIINWYKSDSPKAILEFWWIVWTENYNWKNCFKIKLWKIIEIQNYFKI